MSAHPKMSREQRAKQFMPFMPLVGYVEELRRRERKIERESEPELRHCDEDGMPQENLASGNTHEMD